MSTTPEFIIERVGLSRGRLLRKAGYGQREYRFMAEGDLADIRLLLNLLTDPEEPQP